MIPFVVTGMPRSSTKWTARLLTEMGMPCTHEVVFDRWTNILTRIEQAERGDSSWIATPFIDQLRTVGVPTVRIVRDPLDVVGSLCGEAIPGFHWGKRAAFMAWVDGHVPLDDDAPPHHRALAWWIGWNNIGTPDLTLKAPLNVDGVKQVRSLLKMRGRMRKWPDLPATNVAEGHPTFTWDDFPSEMGGLAREMWENMR